VDFFGSEIKTRYTLCVRFTLCDVDHLSQQNRGFLMILPNIFSSEPHLEMGM
jgi:hypothetical protein